MIANEGAYQALVIDDEYQVREFVSDVLRGEGWDVTQSPSAEDAFARFDENPWSVVFCDVVLGGANGFSVLRHFKEKMPEAKVVLMTGHGTAAGALDATAFGAYDYLLKPFDEDRLVAMLQRARDRLALVAESEQNRTILSLLDNLKASHSYLERFVVRIRGRMLLLPVEEVDWIESEDKYVRLHVKSASYLIRDTLTRLQGALDPKQFLRVHRSTIVRLGFVQEIYSDFHGDHRIVLRNGRELSLGRNYRDHFFDSIERR